MPIESPVASPSREFIAATLGDSATRKKVLTGELSSREVGQLFSRIPDNEITPTASLLIREISDTDSDEVRETATRLFMNMPLMQIERGKLFKDYSLALAAQQEKDRPAKSVHALLRIAQRLIDATETDDIQLPSDFSETLLLAVSVSRGKEGATQIQTQIKDLLAKTAKANVAKANTPLSQDATTRIAKGAEKTKRRIREKPRSDDTMRLSSTDRQLQTVFHALKDNPTTPIETIAESLRLKPIVLQRKIIMLRVLGLLDENNQPLD